MVTLALLQSEQWWDREVVPEALDWLGDALCAHYRLPRYHAGTKGDEYHLNGAHRSQEWIQQSRFCTDRLYTTTAGLSAHQKRYIAGFDFTPGSDTAMVTQCRRLWHAVRSGELEEVTEFYGNVDGDKIVDGWDNIDNLRAWSDASHLWHWHLSVDRAVVDQLGVAQKIFRIVTAQEADVSADEFLTAQVKLRTDGDVQYSNPTTTVAGVLASTNYYVLQSRNKLMAALAQASLRDAAILAALKGEPDTAKIMERIDQRHVEQLAALAGVRKELAQELAPALADAVRDQLDDIPPERLNTAMDEALRRVLGSLDTPAA